MVRFESFLGEDLGFDRLMGSLFCQLRSIRRAREFLDWFMVGLMLR